MGAQKMLFPNVARPWSRLSSPKSSVETTPVNNRVPTRRPAAAATWPDATQRPSRKTPDRGGAGGSIAFVLEGSPITRISRCQIEQPGVALHRRLVQAASEPERSRSPRPTVVGDPVHADAESQHVAKPGPVIER